MNRSTPHRQRTGRVAIMHYMKVLTPELQSLRSAGATFELQESHSAAPAPIDWQACLDLRRVGLHPVNSRHHWNKWPQQTRSPSVAFLSVRMSFSQRRRCVAKSPASFIIASLRRLTVAGKLRSSVMCHFWRACIDRKLMLDEAATPAAGCRRGDSQQGSNGMSRKHAAVAAPDASTGSATCVCTICAQLDAYLL